MLPIGMSRMKFGYGYGKTPDEAYAVSVMLAAYEFNVLFGHNEEQVRKVIRLFCDKMFLAAKFH